MKQFSDLCQAYTKAKTEFDAYVSDCDIVAQEIWNTILSYNQIPPTQIALYLLDEMGNCFRSNDPISKTMILREDGFFEFGIGITIFSEPTIYPHETVVVAVNVAKTADNMYKAKLGADGRVYEINLGSKHDVELFTDAVLESVEMQYQTGLMNMVNKNTFRRIGFK